MGQMIVEDIIETWSFILVGLLGAMLFCLIIIAVMRWMATPLIWLSILGIITMLGFGETHYSRLSLVQWKFAIASIVSRLQ